MGATTQYTTFEDLYLALQYRVRLTTGTSGTGSITQQCQAMINSALHNIYLGHDYKFPWLEKQSVLITHATYTTGTVTIADATRTTVTGSSTAWNTAVTGMGFNNARAGGKIKFDDTHIYEVSTVSSDTSMTLVDRYVSGLGTGLAAGSSYTYFEDEYALASDFLKIVDGSSFDLKGEIRVLPRSEFYRRHPVNNIPTPKPIHAMILHKGVGTTTDTRPRVVLGPPPSTVSRIAYRYITKNTAVSSTGTEAENMSATTDEPLGFPLRYREAILLYALSEWYRDKKDDSRSGEVWSQYVDIMQRILADVEIGARQPRFAPQISGYALAARRPYAIGRGRSRPYDISNAFDREL